MKKNPLLIIATVLLSSGLTVRAQTTPTSWLIAGNSNITTSKFLGTTNNQPVIVKTNNAERIRILGNGNVGIGTATPATKLEVFNGNLQVTSTTGSANLIINRANSLAGTSNQILFADSKVNKWALGGTNIGSAGANNLSFYNYAAGSNALTILSSNNNVGIGTTNPSAKLEVNGTGTGISGTTTSTLQAGVFGYSANSWGVKGESDGYVGVGGTSENGTGVSGVGINGRGVTGSTYNSNSYAGYFNGHVYSTGSYEGSDRTLKQNIRDFASAMSIINKLHPTRYQFRQDGNYKLMNLPAGSHYGLIAQDVEKVLPNLIKETKFEPAIVLQHKPGTGGTNITTADVINFKALNYTELIPIIIKGMQELSAQNDSLKKENTEMKSEIGNLKSEMAELKAMIVANQSSTIISSASLQQNIPNPFNKSTTIRYHIPHGCSGQINIYDQTGKLVKALNANASGQSELNGNDLAAGTYTYILMVNGKISLSKQMLVIR